MSAYNSYAADMALKRQQYHIGLIGILSANIQFMLMYQRYDNRERIVNREGKVVQHYQEPR